MHDASDICPARSRFDGAIHGRFQPFHNAHLAYALAALGKAEVLYVGLARVLTDPGIGADVAPHRLTRLANPLSYYERSEIIRAALISAGVPDARFEIGPFPIEEPKRIPEFCPRDVTCYTTIVDAWNRRKISELEGLGYSVEVLESVATADGSVATGTEIRRLIRSNDAAWRNFVPAGAAAIIERYYEAFSAPEVTVARAPSRD